MRAWFAALAFVAAMTTPVMAEQTGPDPRIIAMRDEFEREFLRVEKDAADDQDRLMRDARALAARIYGADWSMVHAEAVRGIAALPELDLAPYVRRTAERPLEDFIPPDGLREALADPVLLAMMRYWEPHVVGAHTAALAADLNDYRMPNWRLGLIMSMAPTRTFRARWQGQDVLAVRYVRKLIVIPYSITAIGVILPDYDQVRVYPATP